MSGIVGIVNLDGALVDRDLLWRMTEHMSYRGPDDQEIWIDRHVGFGHTLLRTTFESETEKQPFSLDGKVWLTADARIDGRADLIHELESKGGSDFKSANDAELILHAYHAWGEDCVKHLIGDFAFAIWDGRERRLFCARDQLGVKPFYYAQVANCLIFSNTLNCVRLHPAVSDELNDLAIADFLLFGFNQETSTTSFADIQRLPPAHCLSWSAGLARLNRYWILPVSDQLRYKRPSEYVDHFRALLHEAVRDRVRIDPVAVSMSGGLDSTTIAATANELLTKKSKPFDLRAFTIVYDQLLPDQERHYSGLVAEKLGIPIHYRVADSYAPFDRIDQPELRYSEPSDFPLPALVFDYLNQVAGHSRVLLCGEGGDPLMFCSWLDLTKTLKEFRLGPIFRYAAWHIWTYAQLPRLGCLAALRNRLGRKSWHYSHPVWINELFAKRLDLTTRLERINKVPTAVHPTRPEAYNNFLRASWVDCFERGDPGVTSIPVETRYPFFDIRLVNYMLAIPSIPWCVHKELLRIAMRGVLPESIRRRPKTPLAGNQLQALLRAYPKCIDGFEPAAGLDKYVNRDAILRMSGEQDSNQLELNLRLICLNYWLHSLKSVTNLIPEEEYYEATG